MNRHLLANQNGEHEGIVFLLTLSTCFLIIVAAAAEGPSDPEPERGIGEDGAAHHER